MPHGGIVNWVLGVLGVLGSPVLLDDIAFDPSLWWNDGGLVKSAATDLRAGRNRRRSLYMATSSQGDVDGTVSRLAAVLISDGGPQLTSKYVTFPSELHSTIFHPAAIVVFRALLAPLK